ncbi:unnamed protein product [Adineta ricciae]|uniref:Uncharacterized protein n=1 Tax=Adineta ricciae TaxID=249248 RepID=A0A814UT27_ADIRI|nr:unnamed protein product [Adineta ricciae]
MESIIRHEDIDNDMHRTESSGGGKRSNNTITTTTYFHCRSLSFSIVIEHIDCLLSHCYKMKSATDELNEHVTLFIALL